MMQFYNQQHRFYAGIDLHARSMHVCVLDASGTVVLDRNLARQFATLLQANVAKIDLTSIVSENRSDTDYFCSTSFGRQRRCRD
jgi:hypothetical protein